MFELELALHIKLIQTAGPHEHLRAASLPLSYFHRKLLRSVPDSLLKHKRSKYIGMVFIGC